ncbi:hypothetical protein ACIQBJ_12155 [Kitasatospora sp. NPDC088391]|uniref:hypothetical protein n=1 Tax=Kitasatospora sp. NPDC088391 TaxID=3364074 RepID=UPI00382EC6CE
MSARRILFVPAALALGAALTLTACGSDKAGGSAQAAKPSQSATAGTDAGAAATTAPQPAASTPAAGAPAPGNTGAARPKTPTTPTTATGAGSAAGGGESYAYTHSCKAANLTVKVTTRGGNADQRVIEVHNQGSTYCGLSYYPLVSVGKSADRGNTVTPLVPGGLGGPPAYALAPGKSTFAVIDLNPGSGSAGDYDELNVLADDQMPNADTRNFPLGAGAKVGKQPKLGLYADSADHAAQSTALAGKS